MTNIEEKILSIYKKRNVKANEYLDIRTISQRIDSYGRYGKEIANGIEKLAEGNFLQIKNKTRCFLIEKGYNYIHGI